MTLRIRWCSFVPRSTRAIDLCLLAHRHGEVQGGMVLQPHQAGELMNALQIVGVGLALLLATGSTLAQNGTMMNDGTWGSGWMGGYGGGYGVMILVLAVVVGLVVWVVNQQKK